jgi:hypothetical protein
MLAPCSAETLNEEMGFESGQARPGQAIWTSTRSTAVVKQPDRAIWCLGTSVRRCRSVTMPLLNFCRRRGSMRQSSGDEEMIAY